MLELLGWSLLALLVLFLLFGWIGGIFMRRYERTTGKNDD